MSNDQNNPRVPTVRYDTERSQSSLDPLDPPDIDSILKRKRKWYRHLLVMAMSREAQLPLTCLSIAVSAVQANGVYVWPTYGPVVAKMLELTTAQAQTIVVGGILGVYLMAAPLGALTDRYGTRFASLVSAFLSALGYLSFAVILRTQTPETPFVHLWLTAAYFCVGAATVGSYFAALTCASLSFPSHPTLSLSVPLSLIGLSSLVLSSFSTLSTFHTPTNDLNAPKFLIFLGILSPGINIFCSIFMRVIPHNIELEILPDEREMPSSPISRVLQLDEHTPLLIGGIEAAREEAELIERGKDRKWSVMGLIKDWEGFWAFGILLALCIGPAETIIASIGSILTSLLPAATSGTNLLISQLYLFIPTIQHHLQEQDINPLLLRNKHVWLLSITGTISRLLVGVLADYLAPLPTPVVAPPSEDPDAPTHLFVQKKKVRLHRSMFAAICAVVLGGIFAWSAGELESERGLWVLSAGTGFFYGALFTLTPAIVSTHFGPTNFGLAWGMISYFAAIGAIAFSYLYADLSSAATIKPESIRKAEPPVCYGTKCFDVTLWIAAGSCVVAAVGLALLGKRWKV